MQRVGDRRPRVAVPDEAQRVNLLAHEEIEMVVYPTHGVGLAHNAAMRKQHDPPCIPTTRVIQQALHAGAQIASRCAKAPSFHQLAVVAQADDVSA